MAIITGPIFIAGSAVSNVVSVGNTQPLVLIMPDDWTQPGNLKCAYSPDSTNFYQLYHNGKEWVCPCVPGTAWVLETNVWPKGSYIRLTSTFGLDPINQDDQRTFKIVTE